MDQDERKKGGAGKPKPIPIREAVGDPGPRTADDPNKNDALATPAAPGLRGQRERPAGARGTADSRKRGGGGRRRPGREGHGSGREERQRSLLKRTPIEDLPFRSFEHEGREWIVRLCGQASTGSAMDPGAPLMHLVFYPSDDPLEACGDLLEIGRSLEGIPEPRLSELLSKMRLAGSANESSR